MAKSPVYHLKTSYDARKHHHMNASVGSNLQQSLIIYDLITLLENLE
jgi:hypothetical protein